MTPGRLAALCVLIGALPLLLAMLGGFIAARFGCRLHGGGIEPCVIRGHDISPWLYRLFMCGWFGMFTVPLGLCGLMGSGIWALVRLMGRH